MSDSVEMLTQVEQQGRQALDHLNQAVQDMEAVHQQYQDWHSAHAERHTDANPHELLQAIDDINQLIHKIQDQHNRVVGQLAQLREHSASLPLDESDPYS